MSQQPIPQAAQVVLPHQRLEHAVRGQHAKAFAEARAAAEVGEAALVGERARLQLVDAEEAGQLGMLAVEDRAGMADRVLAPRERIDGHRVVVARHRLRVVADLQAERIEAEGELDVLPRRGGKGRVERLVAEERGGRWRCSTCRKN